MWCVARSTSGRASHPPSGLVIGLVDYLDFLPADVLLDDLDVLDYLLADTDLLLDYGSFLDHDLFLDHRNHDLLFPDLRCGRSFFPCRGSFDGYTLHGYLDALLGHGEALPLGTHAFAHPHLSSLALTRLDADLLLRAPHPDVIFFMAGHIWRRVGAPYLRRLACAGEESTGNSPLLCVEPVVNAHPSLELGRNLVFVAQARRALHQASGV